MSAYARCFVAAALIALSACDSSTVSGCVGPLCFVGSNQADCAENGHCLCPTASALDDALAAALSDVRNSARTCGSVPVSRTDPMVWDATLDAASRAHALDMHQFGFTDATGSNGLDVASRVAAEAAVGFRFDTTLYQLVTDGKASLSGAIDTWINTPSACLELMSNRVSHAGIACAGNTTGTARNVNRWSLVLGGE